FVVETTRGEIEVLGTRFLVEASAERTTAAVVRGAVALASPDGKVVLHAGEQGVAEPGRPPTRGPAPRLSHLVSWAAQARKRDEHAVRPLRNGTLFAREPNRLDVPESPLPIAKLGVDIVVEDQVARVALDQTFVNPQNLALEGMYRFAIPPDAALQRLAMYVDGTLTESGVVERMAARRIYEDLVYRRVDPALLEWTGTGRLGLRIYPLPARQEKRLVLAYTQSLPRLYDDWTLSVPLPEVDVPVGELAFSVRVKGCANCELSSPSHPIEVQRSGEDAVVSYHARGARLGDSLVLRARDRAAAPVIAGHTDGADRYLVVRARPELGRAAAAYRPRTWVILDDVSASRGPMELRAQADLIDGFLRELDEDDRVAVVAFDVAARTVLAPTRVDDVDRRAVRRALNDEGGAGATSFAVAIAEAHRLLAGVAPADARIVYLGDGVITSDARNLDALRAQLAGKAQFIGVGVGDGPDTQTLDALAAATGGYATTLDLSDDLGWRAFDLVAALHTARITRLTARLVDAGGAEIPATSYLRSPQLADGEQLELVTKLAGEGRPVAVELAGVVDGAPWQQRIALDGATHEAGYLPRLWAHRHIAARLLAKHEPVALPPCATESARAPQIVSAQICPTEAELREQRDEAIRREVVELGKRYFLLSRHTSLLVLENDEMYRKYGVAKGAGETWAPYVVPAKIPVVTLAAVATGVADDAELVRSPVPLFAEDLDAFDDVRSSDRWLSIVGAQPVQSQTRLELGLASPSGGPPPPPVSVEEDAPREVRAAGGLSWSGVGRGGGGSSPRPDFVPLAQTVTTSDLQSGLGHSGTLGFLGKGSGVRRARRVPGQVAWFSAMNPRQLNHPSDPAYDDLTGFVPALFDDELVSWRKQLAAGGGEKPHAIEPGARELLERARRALPAGVYRWDDREIAVDAARRLGWRRTTDANLAETASFDGATLTRRYGELDLDVSAALGDADVALGLAHLPIWIADPAHYARWFEVRLTGPRQISLVPPASAKGAPASGLVIELDAQDRVVSIARSDGGELVRVAWSASGPTSARVLGRDVAVGFTGQAIADAASWAHGAAVAGVTVELPLRMPAFRAGQARALAVGSAAWRHAMRQWMASLAATSDRATLVQAFAALREHGGIARGELVLASGGLGHGASPAQTTSGL
ncbi:MAG: VIT domain-containing protein, partial [Kofleriaceae bacterium]